MLLIEAEHGIEGDHDEDDDHVLDIANKQRQPRRDEQDDDQHALELVDELEPGRARRRLGEPVGAVLREASFGLLGGQAAGAAALALERVAVRQRVPGGRWRRGMRMWVHRWSP